MFGDVIEAIDIASPNGEGLPVCGHRGSKTHIRVRNEGAVYLQINWKNEFTNVEVLTAEADYMKKVESLLLTLQTSVKEMIARTRVFAEADLTALLA